MAGNRLLIVAEPKVLPVLASGLRDGGKFEVLTAALSDRAAAQAALENADAVALFYGAPGAPLQAALQALAPKLRARGGRVVAVLQREQMAQRDDCFRAGASDLLFMPMPKEQFVARLQASVALSWPAESGAPAPISVATRSAASKVPQATVSPAGVEAAAELPVKAGETVRVAWGTFQHWGLVVRVAPSLQIRFAGLAPEEEAQIRDWLKSGAQVKAAPAVSAPAPAAPKPAETPLVRAHPASGPPPGFADRKPVRPQTRTGGRVPPPVMGATAPASKVAPPAAAAAPAAPAAAPASPAPAVGPNGSEAAAASAAMAGLFDEGAAAPAAAQAAGPTWPVPAPPATCIAAAAQFLKDKTTPPGTPPAVTASTRKIVGVLGSSERAAVEAGQGSPLADVIAARIALDAATAEGVRLYSSIPAATMDGGAVAAMTKLADEAAARLQKEADAAIGKGQVESLQILTAASAALSRDLLTFKETADRLRGIGAAPRMGAGALDPEMVLPGQAPRPRPLPSTPAQAPVKAELRDFRGLDEKPGRAKNVLMVLLILGAIAAAANGFYFALPHHTDVPVAGAGEGITRIDMMGDSAMVTVTPDWVAHVDARMPLLVGVLRGQGVEKAILVLPTGGTVGILDVTAGKLSGRALGK